MRWSGAFVRTSDIDPAGDVHLDIALPNVGVDLPQVLENLQMGFLPIPPLNPKQPSTSFTIRGQSVRVDFLTPAYGSHREGAVFIDRFRVAAQRLSFLDYLLKGHVSAGVINGGGILVNVSHPARYAFHKLIVSRSRDVVSQTKAEKDIRQAMQLLEVLAEDRPGDVVTAWEALQERGGGWVRPVKNALAVCARRDKKILDKVLSTIPQLRKM